MISYTTKKFRKLFSELPINIQKQAGNSFNHFKKDSYYPGLNFKKVHSKRSIYAVRISRDYRALGIIKKNSIIWF
jgi:hypothetical protein